MEVKGDYFRKRKWLIVLNVFSKIRNEEYIWDIFIFEFLMVVGIVFFIW